MTTRFLPLQVLAAGLACLLVTGCGSSADTASSPAANPEDNVADGGGTRPFPAETVTDVLSYADAVAVFRVTAERATEPEPGPDTGGSGYVSRDVDIEVSEVLWQAPQTQPLPAKLTLGDGGWLVKNGAARSLSSPAEQGSLILTVGSTYVAPLLYLRCSWLAINEGTLAVDPKGSRITSLLTPTRPALAREFLKATTVEQLATQLKTGKQDAIANGFRDREADSRFVSTLAQGAGKQVAPGISTAQRGNCSTPIYPPDPPA